MFKLKLERLHTAQRARTTGFPSGFTPSSKFVTVSGRLTSLHRSQGSRNSICRFLYPGGVVFERVDITTQEQILNPVSSKPPRTLLDCGIHSTVSCMVCDSRQRDSCTCGFCTYRFKGGYWAEWHLLRRPERWQGKSLTSTNRPSHG